MTYGFGGMSFGVGLAALLDEAKARAGVSDFTGLGSSSDYRNEAVARMLNNAIEELVEACPALGMKTADQAIVNGTAAYTVPTDIHTNAIEKITFNDSGTSGVYDLQEIKFASAAEIAQLPESWRNGDVTSTWPEYWGFNRGASSIQFYPCPGAAKTVVIHYREEPTAITGSLIGTPAATSIDEIPTRFQDVLALRVAMELAERLMPTRAAELRIKFSNSDPAMPGALERMQKVLNRQIAADRADQPGGLFSESNLFGLG